MREEGKRGKGLGFCRNWEVKGIKINLGLSTQITLPLYMSPCKRFNSGIDTQVISHPLSQINIQEIHFEKHIRLDWVLLIQIIIV